MANGLHKKFYPSWNKLSIFHKMTLVRRFYLKQILEKTKEILIHLFFLFFEINFYY